MCNLQHYPWVLWLNGTLRDSTLIHELLTLFFIASNSCAGVFDTTPHHVPHVTQIVREFSLEERTIEGENRWDSVKNCFSMEISHHKDRYIITITCIELLIRPDSNFSRFPKYDLRDWRLKSYRGFFSSDFFQVSGT